MQEYFEKPSLQALQRFRDNASGLSEHDRLLCRKLLKQYPGMTARALSHAENELQAHLKIVKLQIPVLSNIIALGLTKEGKVRLAIVDL